VSYREYTGEQIRTLRGFYRVLINSNTPGLNTRPRAHPTRGDGRVKGHVERSV